MRRVAVIGSPGAGKSTFSRQLGERLNIDVIHLDAMYWNPGWVETPSDEWAELQRKLIQKDEWIIDGNYGSTIDIRMKAADTIILLDLTRLLCVYRAIKRRVQYRGDTRQDMGDDCPEKFNLEFYRFIKYIWKFPKTQRLQTLEKLKSMKNGKEVIILRSKAEVETFLYQ